MPSTIITTSATLSPGCDTHLPTLIGVGTNIGASIVVSSTNAADMWPAAARGTIRQPRCSDRAGHSKFEAHVQLVCNLWYHGAMIDFPITELLDNSICIMWLERHLHPEGFTCPHCGSTDRRLFRQQKFFPAYRCRDCDGYYTLLTGTAFEKTRQSPASLVLLLRGITKGESTARLARELGMSRQQVLTLRQRVQTNLNDSAPTDLLEGTTFEADELCQNAGEKKYAPSRPRRSAPPARQ